MSTSTEITKNDTREIEQPRQRRAVAPPVDIYENADELLVVADVPGATSEGISLDFEDNKLLIHAATVASVAEGTPLFRELADVDYRRAFELAPGIDAEKISAELHGGTLRIHLPKSAALKPRQIPVTTG